MEFKPQVVNMRGETMPEETRKSDAILERINNNSFTEAVIEVDEQQVKLVIFSLQHHLFAFMGNEVRELLPAEDITWIPGATDVIPGVINVRGDIAAIIDLGRVMGLADTRKQQGFFVMTQGQQDSSGIAVDTIIDVLDIPISTIQEPLSHLDMQFGQFVVKQFEWKDCIVNILSVNRILDQVVV